MAESLFSPPTIYYPLFQFRDESPPECGSQAVSPLNSESHSPPLLLNRAMDTLFFSLALLYICTMQSSYIYPRPVLVAAVHSLQQFHMN